MAPRTNDGTSNNNINRDRERQKYKSKLSTALNEEDDPLAVYHQFVQWTIKNYGEVDPNSGLVDLLKEATSQFKNDSIYKTDLRYLKMWALYARQAKQKSEAIDIYADLVASDIGTSYSALYEDYAGLLEGDARWQEAEAVYRKGIKRSARPLERLKTRYREFQSRVPSSSVASSSSPSSSDSSKTVIQRNLPRARVVQSSGSSSSTPPLPPPTSSTTFTSTAASRYALMLAPPAPGKRPEKLRFDLSLLFSEGVEYSIQEARARSKGLLGKKWGPPPESEYSHFSSASAAPVQFNDDGKRSSRLKPLGRKSLMGGAEPTVTINTKEALADVFGMYNSPDKTNKLIMPGSKHAPLKSIDPMTPVIPPRINFSSKRSENMQNAKTPTSGGIDPVFSKVFTPASKSVSLAPLRDVFTDDHGKPLPRAKAPQTHERAKSDHEVLSSQPDEGARLTAFTPFKDENARTPFKVFSRPPEQGDRVESVFTPKTPSIAFIPFTDPKPLAFTPFKDAITPAFKPFVDNDTDSHQSIPAINGTPEPPVPSFANTLIEIEDDDETSEEQEQEQENQQDFYPDQDQEQYYEDDSIVEQYEEPLASEHIPEEYEGESYQEVPLGGRFGQFNVMTPITERTCEFTSSTTRGTPSNRHTHSGKGESGHLAEYQAAEAAERLAAELHEEGSEDDEEGQALDPLRLSAAHLPSQPDPEIVIIEERTGSLNLVNTLTLNSKFRPTNPCNPFGPAILSNLISRIPTDPHFYDLRGQQSNKLNELQRFTKKSRKTSSGSNDTGILDCGTFALVLRGHKFNVTEKLGEGGFGSVFKARDAGVQMGEEDEDEDFDDGVEDEELSSMVALKVVKPRNIWEYHVLRRLHSSLPLPLRRSVVLPHALYAFDDESYLVLDLCPQGMLLNIVNNAVSAGVSQAGACLDELLVMFFSIELLRLVEAMHNAGFIHGDLKIDNCLLRLEDVPGGATAWSSKYQPSGEGGWSYKGLKVIDFGRTIDTKLFPPDQQFIADWATDDRDCFEIREDRPWTFQTDYFGLVGIIYCMLFGKYIQANSVIAHIHEGGVQKHKIATPFKRYWQTDIWNRLFDVLLNPCMVRPAGELPVCDALGELRKEMEQWLQANCDRTSNTLKGLLKKVEMSCY